MKLGKTQVKLLREAAGNRHGLCHTVRFCGHGGGGRVSRGGDRAGVAACKLRDAGLLAFVRHDTDRVVKSGRHMCITTGVWSITGAGRAAIAAHIDRPGAAGG